MSTPTWKARIIRYLLHNGFVLDMTPPHTARYAKYRQVKGNVWYYIGKAGAVRISHQGTVGSAISMTPMVKQHVALWEKTPAGELARHRAGEQL